MKNPEYKHNEYIHFTRVRFKRKSTDENGDEILIPETNNHNIAFDEIDELDINNSSQSIPFAGINVVNMERYMLLYWSAIIKPDCVLLYHHLREYCNTEDGVNLCYPKIDELMERMGKMSRPTLLKKINVLEEYGFLIKIHRFRKDNGKETSPLFKLRDTIPLLSKNEYNQLPKYLQKKHDDYMKRFAKGYIVQDKQPDVKPMETLLRNSDGVISKQTKREIEESLRKEKYLSELIDIVRYYELSIVMKEEIYKAMEADDKAYFNLMFKDMHICHDGKTRTFYIVHFDKNVYDFYKGNNQISSHNDQTLYTAIAKLYGISLETVYSTGIVHSYISDFIAKFQKTL